MPLDPPPAASLEACDGSEMVRARRGNRWRWLSAWTLAEYALAQIREQVLAREEARDAALAALAERFGALEQRRGALEDRLATLEERPAEVVPFSGSITIGALSIGTRSYTVSNLAGIKAGDRVVVQPVNALPAGLVIAAARAPGDGTVEVMLAALIALTGSRTIPLAITALR